MNDLAERGLRALDALRARLVAHPLPALAAAGFVAAAASVYAGGRIGTAPASIPLTTWFGLLQRQEISGHDPAPGAVLVAGIVALCACWLIALHVLRTRTCRRREVWLLSGAWALPFVVGPPILNGDVYAYVARGLVSRASRSPYLFSPSWLGDVPAVGAMDPAWRGEQSTAGPLATFGQHLAVTISGGNPLVAVLLYRALGVVCLIAIGVLGAELAGPRRMQALAMTALNPLLLIYVVSGAHVEGLVAALLLGALVCVEQQRWGLAVLLSCAAAGLQPIALIAVVLVLAAHCIEAGRVVWRRALHDGVLVVACLVTAIFCVRHGLSWFGNLTNITRGHTPFAPANVAATILSPVVEAASFDDLATGGRIAALCAAACVVVYLIVTFRARPLERSVGFALLATGLLAPVAYPWFLITGIACLAPTAEHTRRDWVIALSCVACLVTPPGMSGAASKAVTIAAAAIAACALGPRTLIRRRAAALARRALRLGS